MNYKAPLIFFLNILRRKHHHLKAIGVVLFDKKKIPFFIKPFRYVYIKMYSSVSCKINLYWYANNQSYQTGDLYIHARTAIYEFDMAFMNARSQVQTEKNRYFQYGWISNFAVRCRERIVIKWSKFSLEKLTFEKESLPVIQRIEYPRIIHLELTRKCNLCCYMCRENRTEELKKIGLIDLDPRIFYKMIPFIQKAGHLALFGWGEPLCHPNFREFIDAVGEIKEQNSLHLLTDSGPYIKPFVNFTTNGCLMNESLIHSIIKSRIDEIIFSIDSPNADNYNFIRKGADFERVIANLGKVQELKIENNVRNPAIIIEFVAMRRNIEELPDLVRLAASLNVEKIIVTLIVVSTKGLEQESLYYHQDLANKMIDEAERVAQENGLPMMVPNRFGTKPTCQGYCSDPFETFYVRAEGTVLPCCIAINAVIGDLNKDDPEDVWMSDSRKDFMDHLRKGILIGHCKTCHKFTGNDINLRSTHIKI